MKTKFEVSNDRESVETHIVVIIVNICQEQAVIKHNSYSLPGVGHHLVFAVDNEKKVQHLDVGFDKRAHNFHLTWLVGLELFCSEILTPYPKVLQMICEDIL